jgi:hypothetical protein
MKQTQTAGASKQAVIEKLVKENVAAVAQMNGVAISCISLCCIGC